MNTKKGLTLLLQTLLVVSLLGRSTPAHTPASSPSSTEDTRIARLVGLAKVWGTVKYFHPYLAYRDIDWDKALVDTIPKINATKTPQDYHAAINQMLAVLHDKSTRAEIETETKPTATNAKPSPLVRTENGQLIIEAAHIAEAVAKDISTLGAFSASINQSLPNSSGVIIDARSDRKLSELEAYHLDNFLRQTLTAMLDTNVVLGATRYRMHNGYATQTAGGSGFYYSALVTASPKTIVGRGKTKTPPLAFIINEHSPSFADVLSGLRSAGRAQVVLEGEQAPGETFTMDLPDGVRVQMRTAELINPDGSIDLQPDVTVAKGTTEALKEAMKALRENSIGPKPKGGAAPTTFTDIEYDKSYTEMVFPNAEYRLLALFRYWNVLNHFFPYKHLIGESWQTVLPRYIPKFEANKDAADYQLTVRELITEMRDSHGGVRNANAASEKLGMFLPPVMTGYVESKSVVTKVLDDKLPIKVGDVILAVDGEPVEKKREFLSRYTSASTPQWLMRGVNARLLFGPKDSVVKLKAQGTDGTIRDLELTRSQSLMDPKWAALMERTTPVMQVLPSGYGYVDLDRLQVGEVDKMFEMIKDTPAVIFDMRGYPNGTAWSIAPRLTDRKDVVAALFSRPMLEATNLSNTELADSARYSFAQRIPERQGDVYRGKVVVLINEDAISQAEHTCLFFEAATEVTFIGTPTAGANGDVTNMVLPGNLTVSFSGHDVRHADGRQLQRLGIQPTIRVERTIRGMIAGRDEILDAAVEFLQRGVTKVNDSRPVALAAETLEKKFGWAITYEDPPYAYDGDLLDVTEKVSKDFDKTKPGQARRVLIPKGGELSFEYSIDPATNKPANAAVLVQQLLDAYAIAGNPGIFRLEQNGNRVHIIPSASRAKNGALTPHLPVLDTVITVPAQKRTGIELLTDFCAAVSRASGTSVVIGSAPLNMLYRYETETGAKDQKARDFLSKELDRMSKDVKLSWQMLFDAVSKTYYLNIHAVKSGVDHRFRGSYL